MSAAPSAQPADAPVWKALADPTRRRILDELRRRPLPTGKLAAHFDMTRFGVMKHLRVLQDAGLVLVEERGRERWNHVNPVPIRDIHRRWIRTFEEEDADRLLRIRSLAEKAARTATMSTTESPTATDPSSIGVRNVHVEVLIEAPVEHVWKTMVLQTSEWWSRDFCAGASPEGFHIEPELGGRMFEDWGGGNGLIWGRVNGVEAPKFLQIVGDSSTAFGGPHRNIMTWTLDQPNDAPGTTRLRLEHSVFGRITQETADSFITGWNAIHDSLKRCAESSTEG